MSITINHDIEETEISHGPREVTVENVQYWSRHTKELAKTQVSKALKFVDYGCVRYAGDFDNSVFNQLRNTKYEGAKHIFIVLPLNTEENHSVWGINFTKKPYVADYNTSEYIIYKKKDGTFSCNCQGYQQKEKKGELVIAGSNCSHVLALYYCFKMGVFKKNEKD